MVFAPPPSPSECFAMAAAALANQRVIEAAEWRQLGAAIAGFMAPPPAITAAPDGVIVGNELMMDREVQDHVAALLEHHLDGRQVLSGVEGRRLTDTVTREVLDVLRGGDEAWRRGLVASTVLLLVLSLLVIARWIW